MEVVKSVNHVNEGLVDFIKLWTNSSCSF